MHIGGFGLQPSEFLKPFFIVTTAWVLSADFGEERIPAKQMSFALYVLVAGLLILQPDFGQTVLISFVWFAQMALAGLPIMWIGLAVAVGVLGVGIAYTLLPHVASRIDRFINPGNGDTFQVDKAMEAFGSGGLVGKGPGEGTVKLYLPDAHSDYIFAVVGEEFGAVAGVMLLLLFAGIVVRGLAHLLTEENPFRLLAAAGLIIQFGLQALINIGVNLSLLPSKGMTLPFISYGGSSMLALAIGMGMAAGSYKAQPVYPTRDGSSWMEGCRMRAPYIILAAGGTGGHMMPAEAVADVLTAEGYDTALITDKRGEALGGIMPNIPHEVLGASSPYGRRYSGQS